MTTPDPPDDDQCQVTFCHQTHFTYCPHCQLFVCIQHLNEHYANYKQEYQLLVNDGKQQQILNKQFLDDIIQEQKELFNFFQEEINYYHRMDQYFHDKANQTSVRPQDCSDLRLQILQSSQKRVKFKKFLQQIQQLIKNYQFQKTNTQSDGLKTSLPIKTEEIITRPRFNKSSPLAQFSIDYEEIDDDDDEDEEEEDTNARPNQSKMPNSDTSSVTKISQREATTTDDKDIPDELIQSDDDMDEDDESDNDHSGSDPDFGGHRRSTSPNTRRKRDPATSRPAVNHFQVPICPLANNTYGIDLKKHPLRYVPCTRNNISSIYLFTHLRVYHCLSSKASLRLVRHIMYNGCERDCDLFSQANESLVNILPKSYRGHCPLTKLGAFGLTKFHDIRLCEENQTHENTGLLNHFVVFHCLSYPWANKLCNAMQAGDYDGTKQILFKPNEPIKAKKWLTTQGKLILAKRYSSIRKRRKKFTNNNNNNNYNYNKMKRKK